MTTKTQPPRTTTRTAFIVAGCAAIGLFFAARGARGGETSAPPAASTPAPAAAPEPLDGPSGAPETTGQELGEADSPDAVGRAIEGAVDEAEAESLAETAGKGQKPAQVTEVPATTANAVVQHSAHLPGLSLWRKAHVEDGAWVASTDDGKRAKLSVDPHLQKQMQSLLAMYKPMAASVVAIDPKTGKVLAMAEYAQDGAAQGLATKPLYPAASVFKIVTGAALLEKGVSPDAEVCYHGGLRGIAAKLLQDTRLDRRCLSLSMALAKSANVVFAKMAVKHLDSDGLRKEAERFFFNKPIWDQPVEQSSALIPASGLDFAKSAAGFGEVKLSPLHAALIAAAVGNGGVAVEPSLLDSVDGVAVPPTGSTRLLQAETAASLRDMMKLTVSQGTAASSFRDRRGRILGDIVVAGKTGSLSNHQRAFKDYSWFVGFAPADDPKIAVAAVVVNGLKWKMHAPYVAREALKAYLVGGPLGQPPAARARRAHHRRRR